MQFNLDNLNMDVFTANQEAKYVNNLNKSKQSPYFARIDFRDDSADVIEVYIGITGVKDSNNFYVFDWRTPIASLYYNYEKGVCQYDAPSGVIEGEIILRRQYKIIDQKLIRCFNSDINISDDYLQEILSSASGSKMKNIVDTIQLEQNKIIRNENDSVLIVQGTAGSGKTSVAMHRIAYILYKQKLTSSNVLIFSPNSIFSEYISNVLPELGEDNVLQTTFSAFASTYLENCEIEDFSEFLDNYYNLNIDSSAAQIIKVKQSTEFANSLKDYMDDYHKKFSITSDIKVRDDIIVRKEEINTIFTNNLNKFSVKEKIEYIIQHICDINKLPYSKYFAYLKQEISKNLTNSINAFEIYNDFLTKEGLPTINVENNHKLNYEDITPVIYILFRMNGFPYSYNIKQVVIDEAQDYNLLQFELIKNIFSKAKFTILGDINQTINPFFEHKSLSDVIDVFDEGKYIELTKTYRSSEEIISYSNKILNLTNVCAMRHENSNKVCIRNVSDEELFETLKADIRNMQDKEMKKIAIICKNCDETQKIYNLLKNEYDIINIQRSNEKKIGNLTILPSFLAKGLEFDGVIVYTERKNKYMNKDKKLYYVACTRAQHMLVVYNQDVC